MARMSISSSDMARSFIHLRRKVHLTAISASKIVTGIARSVTWYGEIWGDMGRYGHLVGAAARVRGRGEGAEVRVRGAGER